MMQLEEIWQRSKCWRSVSIGPVSLFYRLGTRVRVSSNRRRRLLETIRRWLLPGSRAISPAYADVRVSPIEDPKPREGAERETAVLVGVGPGFGFALARKLVLQGMHLALAARNAERLDPLVEALRAVAPAPEQQIHAYGCDATDEGSVRDLYGWVCAQIGVPHFVSYGVHGGALGLTMDIEVAAIEESWRQNCLGAFILGREAARLMAPLGRGTIVFAGSTSGIIGRANHLNLAIGKFGLRALSQVMARELWPQGVHVVHLLIDADIREPGQAPAGHPQSDPDEIAMLILALHRQAPNAWSSEVDLRPNDERFWAHC